MFFIEDFFIRSIIAGIFIALIVGPLGCFVIWNRISYLGDSIAHSSVFGIAFGILIGISSSISVILITILFAIILVYLQHRYLLANDTIIGIIAHTTLAAGIIILDVLDKNLDIHAYLFGNILAVAKYEIYIIIAIFLIIYVLLIKYWKSFILITINKNLAKSDGINIFLLDVLMMLMIAVTIASSIRIVGAFLITSMLIIPAAASRQISSSPVVMAVISTIVSIVAMIGGLALSYNFDLLSGPSVIIVAVILFIIISLFKNKLIKC